MTLFLILLGQPYISGGKEMVPDLKPKDFSFES